MCDNQITSSKLEGSASPTSQGGRSLHSRDQSPDLSGSADISEHSMECSILSDSSEEGISPSEVLAGEIESDGKLLDGEAGENGSHAAEIQLLQQPMAEGKEANSSIKKKKTKMSSRRERKISLSGKVNRVKVSARTCYSSAFKLACFVCVCVWFM